MEKIKKRNKIKKMVGLFQDEINLINGYAASSQNDFSTTIRELVLRGLENITTADDLKNNVNFAISKLEKKNEELQNIIKENEKKTMKIMMHILKYAAKNNSLAKTFESKKSGMTPEDFKIFVERVETNSVKNMFVKIKEVEEKEDEKI